MTSQINPNNVDGTYPVAGQPNNTQGFRDNFTNIKTNFSYAETEITDLQNNGIFKAALAGTTLNNNMADNLIYAVKLQDVSYTFLQNAATSGSIAIDYSAGQYQYISTTGSISLNFSNWPASGSAGIVQIAINVTNTAYTLTLPAAVTLGTTGIQGYSGGVITFAATGTYQFSFSTSDGGTIVTIYDLNRPLNYDTNTVNVAATTASTSTTSGALIVAGGVGIGGNLNVGGSIKSTSATAGIGYGTGAGGTVTQATSKSTGVTLNKVSGQITMNAAALSAAAEVSFTFTNSTIAATDVVVTAISSGATAGAYNTHVDALAAGSCRISITNFSTGPLSEAIVINFVVIKGVAA
jgi:hypothetical protein